MIQKIISGAREGVEQAALDVALKLEIPHSGWVSKGCKSAFPKKFNLKETASATDDACREKNIVFSDGTLFLSSKECDDDLNRAKHLAKTHQKPFLDVDFRKTSRFESALTICKWIIEHQIQTLHVTGEKAEKGSQVCMDTMDVLESAVYLSHVEYNTPLTVTLPLVDKQVPKTIDDAVDLLISDLPLKDRVIIANMTLGELGSLNITLGKYIREAFGLWEGNAHLMESCRVYAKDPALQAENASILIIKLLWEKIKGSHRLRIVR
jgi:hypothetical protein